MFVLRLGLTNTAVGMLSAFATFMGRLRNLNWEENMARLTHAVRNFVKHEEGAALVEYGILIALIAVVCLVVVALLGNKVSSVFQAIVSKL
jgi:pilus assembly protein Flp/PilA